MATYLYNADNGRDHAYTTDGKNYYLSQSGTWWAYQSGNYLYDATTSKPIAYWSGKYFYDATTSPALRYRL